MATNLSHFFLPPPKDDPDPDLQQPDRAEQADKTDESKDTTESKPYRGPREDYTIHSASSSPSTDTYFDDPLKHGVIDGDSGDAAERPVLRRRRGFEDLKNLAKSSLESSESVAGRVREAVRGFDPFHRNSNTGRQRSSSGQFPDKPHSKTPKNGAKSNASRSDGEYEDVPSGSSKAAGKDQLSAGRSKLSFRTIYSNPTYEAGLAPSSRPPQIPPLSFQGQPLDVPGFPGGGRRSEAEDRPFRAQPDSQTVNTNPGTEFPPRLRRRDRSPTTFSGRIGQNRPPRSTSSHSGGNAPDTATISRVRGLSESEVVNQDKASVRASVPRPRGLTESFFGSSSTDAATASSTRASKAHLESSSMTTICSAVPEATQSVPEQSNWGLSQSSSDDSGARVTGDISDATPFQGSEPAVNEPSLESSVDGGVRVPDDIAEATATPFQSPEETASITTIQPQENQQKAPGAESLGPGNSTELRPRLPNFWRFEMNGDGVADVGSCSMCESPMFAVKFDLDPNPRPSFLKPSDIGESGQLNSNFENIAWKKGRGVAAWTGGRIIHALEFYMVSCGNCSTAWHRSCLQKKLQSWQGISVGVSCAGCDDLWGWHRNN